MTVQVAIARSVAPEGNDPVYTESNFSPNGLVHFEKADNNFRGTGYHIYCGECDRPFKNHPFTDTGFDGPYPCYRTEPYYGPDSNDYWGHSVSNSPWPYVREYLTDFTTPEVEEDIYTEFDLEDWTNEFDKVDRWYDNDPLCYTSAINPDGTISPGSDNFATPNEPAKRNAYIEGNDGYHTELIIDEHVTARYHARIINLFRDKEGDMRVGSVKVVKYPNGLITATCVNSQCYVKVNGNYVPRVMKFDSDPTGTGDNPSRTAMEDFIMTVIRHGNNHAAKFIRNRPDWYKVHSPSCDLNCNWDEAHCNNLHEVSYTTTDDYVLSYLLEHQQYCKNDKCACSDHMRDLAMPINNNQSTSKVA